MNSVVAQAGGEEFLIAETTDGAEARMSAEEMRIAVASTPWRVTAGVGVASVTSLLHGDDDATLRVIDSVPGGNQIRYSGAPIPRPPLY
jgi:GGDEF domain-containing protein